MRLITIRFSHYCEKARWALDEYQVPYTEEGHLPLFHAPAVKRASRAGSSDRASSSASTPVLVTDEGRVISDSADIVRFVSDRYACGALYPNEDVASFEKRFHDSLAIHSRRFVYGYVLNDMTLFRKITSMSDTGWEARAASLGARPMSFALSRVLNVNRDSVARSISKIDQEMEAMSSVVENIRTPFLCGERLSAADIAFACAAGPAIGVGTSDGYGCPIPELHEMPAGFQEHAKRWRATKAGQFVLDLFREHRKTRVVPYGQSTGANGH